MKNTLVLVHGDCYFRFSSSDNALHTDELICIARRTGEAYSYRIRPQSGKEIHEVPNLTKEFPSENTFWKITQSEMSVIFAECYTEIRKSFDGVFEYLILKVEHGTITEE